jgi:Host cell surface-exposed lipoprotein
VRTRCVNGALTALAAVGVLTVLLFGSVPAAHAAPTTGRDQAVRKAHEYLQYGAFSLKGLVSQLKFEGFSTSDASYGASHSGANWWKEAAAKAKEYLHMQAFSRSGLVAQLKFDGFTSAQALYGARAAGL